MPNKLTDTEVKKALAQCEIQTYCSDCPYCTKIGCKKHLYQDALDLINRQEGVNEKNENIIRVADKTVATQKAKIEALQMDNAQLHSDIINANQNFDHIKKLLENEKEKVAKAKQKVIDIAKALKTAKAEAYKECIEKAKSELKNISKFDFHGTYYYLVGEAFFDNLLKELVGDADGENN